MARKYPPLEKVLLEFRALLAHPPGDKELAQAVIEKLRELAKADHAGLYLWEEKKQEGEILASCPPGLCDAPDRKERGLSPRILPGDGILAEAIRTRQAILVPDIDARLRSGKKCYRAAPESKSEVDIPVRYRDHDLAAFFVSWNRVRGATEEGKDVLASVAPLVGVALLQERQAAELREHERTLEEEVNSSIARATYISAVLRFPGLDLENFWQLVYCELNRVIPCEYVSHWTYNQVDGLLLFRDHSTPDDPDFELPKDHVKMLRPEQSLMGRSLPSGDRPAALKVWRKEADRWVNHFEETENAPLEAYANQSLLNAVKSRFYAVLPLTAGGIDKDLAAGVLCAHVSEIGKHKLEHCEALRQAISTALDLLSHRRRRKFRDHLFLSVFPRIAEFKGDPESWNGMARYVAEQVRCEACSIFMYHDDRQRLQLAGTTGVMKGPDHSGSLLAPADYGQVWYAPGEGGTGFCFQHGIACIGYDAKDPVRGEVREKQKRKWVEALKTQGHSKSLLFVPIYETDESGRPHRPMGVIRCLNKQPACEKEFPRFRQEDVDMVGSLAHALGLFWKNYRIVREQELEKQTCIETLTHEARLPLTALTYQTALLERLLGKLSVSELRHKLKDVRDETLHLAQLMSMEPVLSGRAQYRFKPAKVFADIIFKCISLMENQIRDKGLDVRFGADSVKEIPELFVDEERIHQVVYNILNNAVKYSNPGGTISITAGSDGLGYYISFGNTGVGVPRQDSQRIFEQYQRGSNIDENAVPGMGLGLYVSSEIMKRHSGRITLDRTTDPTVFTLFFPSDLEFREPK